MQHPVAAMIEFQESRRRIIQAGRGTGSAEGFCKVIRAGSKIRAPKFAARISAAARKKGPQS